jgi:predicted enzyme related to lactoylglutathione lyase
MAHTIGWVDIPVHDLDRATAFYSRILGKTLSTEGDGAFKMTVFPHGDGDVAGCLYVDDAVGTTGPLIYFSVDGRLADAVREAEDGGAVI